MANHSTPPTAPAPAASPTGDPWLLTPGPLTTSPEVKRAMQHDYGSRDSHLGAVNRRMRDRLVDIVNGQGSHVCVPLQGSGTFVVEAMIGTFVPRDGKLLILVNGAYGERIAKICDYIGRDKLVLTTPEDTPVDPDAVDRVLGGDTEISHVAVIHCETTTGILNPLEEVAAVTARHGRGLLIDAMSIFGAVELDATEIRFDAVVASSNKCLEATPGLGFCIARTEALNETKGNSPSLSLDLYDQWTSMERTGQWRFTPPVHTIIAFDQALDEFDAEGGVQGRRARYLENCRTLIDGLSRLGFETLIAPDLQAPIIVTFYMPKDPAFEFQTFYDSLRDKGFIIYPGKLTIAETFRIGCIGRLGKQVIDGAVAAIETTLNEMGVTDCRPLAA